MLNGCSLVTPSVELQLWVLAAVDFQTPGGRLATVNSSLIWSFAKLVGSAAATHKRLEISKNGCRESILLGADDDDALIETLAVLSDSGLWLSSARGLGEIAARGHLER